MDLCRFDPTCFKLKLLTWRKIRRPSGVDVNEGNQNNEEESEKEMEHHGARTEKGKIVGCWTKNKPPKKKPEVSTSFLTSPEIISSLLVEESGGRIYDSVVVGRLVM